MKKLKMSLALIIAIVIICLSAVSVFAQEKVLTANRNEDEPSLLKQTMWLEFYAYDYLHTFYLYDNSQYEDALRCVVSSGEDLLTLITETQELHIEVSKGRETSVEEINNYYRKLDEAASKVIILNKELGFLIDFCKLEHNDNLYYPDDVWDEFQEKLIEAEQVYNNGKDTIEVSYAYWELFYAYNEICITNQKLGDVDFDGEVSIFDSTLVQCYLAKLCDLNSSQLIVLNEASEEGVSILNTTELQRYLAKLESDLSDDYLSRLVDNVHCMSVSKNDIFRVFRFKYFL